MDGLRISLLVIGLAVVAAVYLWDRFARRRRARDTRHGDEESLMTARDPYHELDSFQDRRAARNAAAAASGDYDIDDLDADVPPEPSVDVGVLKGLSANRDESLPDAPPHLDAAPRAAEPGAEELVVALTVIGSGAGLAGSEIRRGLHEVGLEPGTMDIYHRDGPEGHVADPWFSVANLVEPGVLSAEALEGLVTPGLVVFMQLPGPRAPAKAFDEMLHCAGELAQSLGATVCDERRQPLTAQVANHMRESIAHYERRSRLRH